MQRVTISMSDAFGEALDAFMNENGYSNRSEAVRDLARLGLERAREGKSDGSHSVAVLAYVYDHEVREIPKRLTHSFHDHHDISVASLHVHLDHDNCLEVAVLRGDTGKIRAFSQGIIAERGVRHGQATYIPIDVEDTAHRDDGRGSLHTHLHPKP